MKLATLKDGSRDGQLVVVSRDLTTAHYTTGIAGRLQQALDDWNFMAPQLQDLSDTLNHGKPRHAFAFDPALCMAPLPRPVAWVEAEAYADIPRPRLWPAGGTPFAGPHARLAAEWAAQELDLAAQLVAVTGDLRAGATAERALESVRLLGLAGAVRLHALAAAEAAAGQPPLHSRPLVVFAPVLVTPDELGEAWSGGRAALSLQTQCNGRKLGLSDTAAGQRHGFGKLLAAWSATRPLRAGSLLGSGPVAHPDPALGHHSLAARRAAEVAADGEARTPWLQHGDSLRLEAKGRDGQSVFGALAPEVEAAG